jgi:predicted nucleic acid-binding Zn finger protein
LESLLGHNLLERALDLIDKKKIVCYKTKSELNKILEIEGSQREVYKFFPEINYCSCYSFRFQVLKNQQAYTCKHVLAARIALILDRVQEEVVSEENFKYLLKLIKIVH